MSDVSGEGPPPSSGSDGGTPPADVPAPPAAARTTAAAAPQPEPTAGPAAGTADGTASPTGAPGAAAPVAPVAPGVGTAGPEPGVVAAAPDALRRRRRQRRVAAAGSPGGTKAQQKHRSKLPAVAATTAVTAIITTVVGGVLSQDRIDSLFTGDEPTESSSAEVEIDYKHVTESERAIAIDVPESWGAVNAAFGGIGGVTSPGLGLRSGPDPMAVVYASDETVWVGASTQAFDDLGLDGLDDAAVTDRFERRLESSVYLPAHGCVPGARHAPHLGDDWVGAVKAWQDCSAIEGWRAIEVEMVSSDRDVYVYLQIGLAPDTPDEVAQRILDSLSVLPSKLPVEDQAAPAGS